MDPSAGIRNLWPSWNVAPPQWNRSEATLFPRPVRGHRGSGFVALTGHENVKVATEPVADGRRLAPAPWHRPAGGRE